MSAKKDDFGPGLAPAIFLGVLTFILGAVLGTVSMISQEVKILTKAANKDELEPGTVYYVRGDRLSRASWEAKEEAWKAGTMGILTVSESELNQWSNKRLLARAPAEPPEGASWMDKLDISVSSVNFLLEGNQLQMATELRVPGLLGDRTFIYQVRGDFVQDGDTVRFEPVTGTLGCAPLGNIPTIKNILFSKIGTLFLDTEAGEWLPATLEGLNSVVISEGQLVLKRG